MAAYTAFEGSDAQKKYGTYANYIRATNENFINRLVANEQRRADRPNEYASGYSDPKKPGSPLTKADNPLIQDEGAMPLSGFIPAMGPADRLLGFDGSGHIKNTPVPVPAPVLPAPGGHWNAVAAAGQVPFTPPVSPASFTRTAPMGAIPPVPQLDFSDTGTVPKRPFNPQYSPNYRPTPTPSARQGYGTGEGVVQRPFNPQYSPNWSGAPLPESVLARQYQNPNAARPAVAASPTVPDSSTSAGALADRTAGLKQAKEGMFFGNPTSGRVGYTTAALLKANSEVMAGGDLAAVVKRLAGNPYMGTVPDALMKALTGVQTARGETYASQLFKKLYRQNADGTWTLVAPVPGSGYPGYPGRTYRPAWGYGGGYGGGGGGSQQSRMIQWKIRIE